MRITHVITRLIVGGAQENTISSVLGLRQKPGLSVDLISGPSPGPEGSLQSTFRNCPEAITLLPTLVRAIHPWKDWLALRQLTEIFRNNRPEVVHTHSGKAGIVGRIAAARAGVPIIIHTIHGPSFGPFQGALANSTFLAAERRAGKVTTHFVSVADAMTRQYLAAGIGRPEQYSKVVSGFDVHSFVTATNNPQVRARFGFSPDDIIVGKVARLFRLKGHDDLLAAAPELVQRCPRMKFLLVGDGEWRTRFENKVRELGLERQFCFTGLVAPEQIPELLGIMDVLVHLSLREGLARALPQAAAAGKPLVAYNCDGAGEICIDGQTGFLLPPRDLKGLIDRLVELADNPSLRDEFGRKGRELVRESFTVQRMVDSLHQLYFRLARTRGPSDS